MKGSGDSTLTEFLERLQYKLAPNVHAPSVRVQRILISRSGVINARAGDLKVLGQDSQD
jgi:hypothetical protein